MFLPDCFQSQVDQTNEPLTEGAIKSLLALNKQRLVELEDIRNVLKPIVSKQKSKEAPPKENAKEVSKAPKKKGKWSFSWLENACAACRNSVRQF